jgi:thiamine biosynthesis protein ThiI
MSALSVTGAVCDRLLFRPCIGMDKEEIIRTARKTDTFDISIKPFEDCCTVFTPKHPKTKPRPEQIKLAEENLDIEVLVQNAFNSTEMIIAGGNKNRETQKIYKEDDVL